VVDSLGIGVLVARRDFHELADLKPSPLEKVRATFFRMMRQAGLMADDGTLTRVVLARRVVDALAARAPK
jgi:hypothetical protein